MNRLKLLIAVLGLLATPGCFQFYGYLSPIPTDPKLSWKTLSTSHFNIHFHDGLDPLAPRVGEICEEVHAILSKEIGHTVWGKVEVVLADLSDRVDARAVEFPYPEMLIYVAPPEPHEALAHYDDWLRLVIFHEYTHVLQQDIVGGFWTPFRYLLGRVVLPAAMIPPWMSEGYAVFEESDKTGMGRNRGTYVEMVMRMESLENHWLPVDQLALGTGFFPYGSQAYYYGGKFHDWLVQKYPKEKFAEYHHRYANHILSFVLLEHHAKKIFGKSYYRLYQDFQAEMTDLHQKERALLEKPGLIEGRRLTFSGETKQGLLYTEDNTALLYSQVSADRRTQFLKIAVSDQNGSDKPPAPKLVKYDFAASDLTWSPDFQTIFYSDLATWWNYYFYSAVSRLDSKGNNIQTVRFSGGEFENTTSLPHNPIAYMKRTSQPHMSSQGNLVFIFRGMQNDILWTASADPKGPYKWDNKTYTLRAITEDPPQTEYHYPRWSPDGKTLVVSKFDPKTKQRDLVLLKSDGGFLRQLVNDPAADFNPVWAPDGKSIYFVSDRTGIYNVFCYDLNTDSLYQVTHVLGGTFFPAISPNGKRLAYLGYHATGFEVYDMELNRDRFIKVHESKSKKSKESPPPPKKKSNKAKRKTAALPPSPESDEEWIDPSNNDDPPNNDNPPPEKASDRLKSYSPFRTLLLPRFFAPVFQINDDDDFIVGGAIGSTDAIRRHSWRLVGYYRTQINEPGAQFVYRYVGWYPELFVTGNVSPIAQSGTLLVRSPLTGRVVGVRGQFEDNTLVQRDLIARAGLSMRIPLRSVPGLDWIPGRHRVTGGYQFISRQNQSDINPLNVEFTGGLFSPVFIPTEYDASGVFLQYSYDSTIQYRRGISPTGEINTLRDLLRGYSLSVGYQVFAAALGGNWNQQVLTLDLRQYRRIPFTDHHVFALRGVGAFTYGDDSNPETFQLGGAYSEGVLNSTTRNFYPLRGFGGTVAYGERMFLLSSEYRFPIVNVERGLGSFPLYLKNIHGAFFVDYGDARDRFFLTNDNLVFDQGFMGVGGEVRSTWQLFYGGKLEARLGYGIPVLARKNAFFDITNGEFIINLGTTF